ncbi:hypothetical protein BGW80DRAFT_1381076 [Lactifluus volemus]|nr:hypothetical protein BGW80DRAFT_1381076 [Lactifluus volemus]
MNAAVPPKSRRCGSCWTAFFFPSRSRGLLLSASVTPPQRSAPAHYPTDKTNFETPDSLPIPNMKNKTGDRTPRRLATSVWYYANSLKKLAASTISSSIVTLHRQELIPSDAVCIHGQRLNEGCGRTVLQGPCIRWTSICLGQRDCDRRHCRSPCAPFYTFT